jgi:YggT family protein
VTYFLDFLQILCEVLTLVILARVIISWIAPGSNNLFINIVYQITEPILAPLRRIIPRAGMFDFTPMAAVILLQLIALLISRI